jgi:hypothetical protein
MSELVVNPAPEQAVLVVPQSTSVLVAREAGDDRVLIAVQAGTVVITEAPPKILAVNRAPSAIGATGPAGPKGDSGGAALAVFATASDTWIFEHNLGFVPSVMLYDPLGEQVVGHIESNTETTTVARFYRPTCGRMSVS